MNNSRDAGANTSVGFSPELSFREILQIVASRGMLIAGVVLAFLAVGTVYVLVASPIYRGDVLIQIEEKKGTTLGGVQQLASALDVSQSPVPGEIELIQSRYVIDRAITSLHLNIEASPERRVPYIANKFERRVGGRGLELNSPQFGLTTWAWGGESLAVTALDLPLQAEGVTFEVALGEQGAFRLLLDDNLLVAGHVGQESAFQISGKECRILISSATGRPGTRFEVRKDPMLTVYQRVLKRLKVQETARQSSVITASYDDTDPHLASDFVNAVAKEYFAQNVSRRSEDTEKSIAFLEQQLPELRKAVEASEEAFNQYRLSKESVNLDKESEGLLGRSTDLEKQRVEAEMKRQELLQRFAPTHPEVVALDNQVNSLKTEEERVTVEIKKLPETEQEFLRLQRDVKVNTDLYTSLLNNDQQLRVAKAGTIGNVYIIDFAIPNDKPVAPNKPLVVGLSAIAGLVIGLSIAFGEQALRTTLRFPDDVERELGAPVYVTIPESVAQSEIFTRKKNKAHITTKLLQKIAPNDPAIEAIRSMRLGLKFAMVGAANKVICITGPLPSIGKTFVSANLAAVLASVGNKVLLIDVDLRRRGIQSYLGLPQTIGLSAYLSDQCRWQDAVKPNVVPNLDVLAAGEIPPNPAELLSRPNLAALLAEVNTLYDYVILDTPPLLPVGDTLTVATLSSTVFIVLRAERSTPEEYRDASRRLDRAGVAIKGVIFNGLQARNIGSKYRYYYAAYEKQ